MPTLVLPPRYTPDSISLWRQANERGWQVERLQHWRAPEALWEHDIILYGESLFAAVVADELGIVLLEAPFHWLADLPETYRKRNVLFTTLAQARQHNQQAFIKPADDKCFPARVYESGSELPESGILPDTTPVLISEVVRWEVEFRCFVLEGKVETFSPYLRYGELVQDTDGNWMASPEEIDEALHFVDSVLADSQVKVPPSVVIDIGVIEGAGWAVVEANPSWGAGIYGCDPAKVLDVTRRGCVKLDNLSPGDKQWVIDRTVEKV
jgi:hypothetical protein